MSLAASHPIVCAWCEGIVLSYSSAEEELSGRRADDVLGRSFFREVAPCTRVRGFEGRWREFLRTPGDTEPFRFPSGPVEVSVVFVRRPSSVRVLVRRRAGPEDRGSDL